MGMTAPISLGTNTDAGTPSTLAITTGSDVPVGGGVLMVVESFSGAPPNAATDSASNTYTRINFGSQLGGPSISLFYAPITAHLASAGTITASWATTGDHVAMQAWTVGGLVLSSPADKTANSLSSGTTPSLSSGTLSQAQEMVLGLIGLRNGASDSYTAASGFTTLASVTQGASILRAEYEIVGVTTSVTWAPTLGTSRNYSALLTTLKAAPSDFLSFMSA